VRSDPSERQAVGWCGAAHGHRWEHGDCTTLFWIVLGFVLEAIVSSLVARKENRGKELEPMGGGRKEKGDSPNGGARIGQPTRASDPTPRRTLVLSRGESHARKNARKLRAKSSCSVAAF